MAEILFKILILRRDSTYSAHRVLCVAIVILSVRLSVLVSRCGIPMHCKPRWDRHSRPCRRVNNDNNGKITIYYGGTPLWCPCSRGISSPSGMKFGHRKTIEYTLSYDETPESLFHLGLNRYRVVTRDTCRTDRQFWVLTTTLSFEAPRHGNPADICKKVIPPESRVSWLHFCRW